MKTLSITMLIVILLFQIKPLRIYLTPLNTLIHEISHGVMALILGGRLVRIKLYASGEGEAATTSSNRLFRLLITYAGYTGSHLFTILYFYLLFTVDNLDFLVYLIMGLLAVSWVLWIRSLFGFIWTVVFFAMTLGAHLYLPLEYQLFFLYFIGCILLYQAFITPFYLIKLSRRNKNDAGDATSMYEVTRIHPTFWSLFFSAQSFVMVYVLMFKVV